MSDKMRPLGFTTLVNWILEEFKSQKSVFGIPESHFFKGNSLNSYRCFGLALENPIGPAAGPHTQLTQNIISSFLTGGRFFELKTVQKMDELEIEKPCIDMRDEGYNTEWSQELKLEQSYDEYVKAWILLHFVKELFSLSCLDCGFIFNMSVGYDLEGIKSDRMDKFIEEMKDSSRSPLFENYVSALKQILKERADGLINANAFSLSAQRIETILKTLDRISPYLSNSVTLSTMHGCPSEEIESIAAYLIREKNLHTYVKLNPTLLGYNYVNSTLHELGFHQIELEPESFEKDLKYEKAIPMLKKLMEISTQRGRQFGIKLSNTLGVKNRLNILPGDDMYMSGRALFPLTIQLAAKLADEFDGTINISFSGGANIHNLKDILECGINPVTIATDLLKPGGYFRLNQISNEIASLNKNLAEQEKIDTALLRSLAENAGSDIIYRKEKRVISSVKIGRNLPMFDCYVAPCQEACPIHQDVAAYINLVEQKKYEEAFELIISKNPLPHITGYICDHQCMYSCTRWDYDDPVQIREMKKVAALNGYEPYLKKFKDDFLLTRKDVKIAILGAGPAGLSAAYFLAKGGFDVTVLEKEMNSGGIVNNILPKFRLPQEAIEKDIAFIEKHGVRFVFGVNPIYPIEKLKKEGYKYIFIAIGAQLSNKLVLTEEKGNVIDAIEFLKEFRNSNAPNLGKRVAVIGGGNSAMDSARAAIRCEGVEKVAIIYRRTRHQMPADKEEFDAAMSENADFKELLLPLKFENGILTCQNMRLGDSDADGRASSEPVENSFTELQFDSVISAIGEHVDKDFLHRNRIRAAHNKAVVNQYNETVIQNVFIGGDALRGPSTVVTAIADAKKASEEIIRRENVEAENQNPKIIFERSALSSFIDRKGNVVNTQHTDNTAEAARCLGCNFVCNKCVDVCPNRANIAVQSISESYRDSYQILHLDGLCNECGNCATFCPYDGAPYKEKLTLFDCEKDFDNSRNNGFYLTRYEKLSTIHFRWKNEEGFATFNSENERVKSSFYSQKEIDTLIEWIRNVCETHPYLKLLYKDM